MSRQLLALAVGLALGGCQVVFPLRDEQVLDAPPGDRDSDGTLDPDDNCPDLFNPDQHDEDQDTIGDLCDNCPHVPNTSQDDNGDGDDVGAACDDSQVVDCIVHFDPFTVPIVQSDDTVGTWIQFDDSYRANEIIPNGYLTVDPTPRTNPLIVVGTHVVELGPVLPPPGDFSNHGVWFASDIFVPTPGVPTDGILAELNNTIDSANPSTAALHLTNGGGLALLDPDTNMVAGQAGEIRLDLRGFSAVADGKLANAKRTLSATGVIGPRQIGLRAYRQKVEFDYLLVIERREGTCQETD